MVGKFDCVNGDRFFDGQIWFETHFVHQCKFDSEGNEDGERDGKCYRTLTLLIVKKY